MKLNRKGYLTVEIILASTIAFAIAFFLIEITVKLVSKTDDVYHETVIAYDDAIIINNIKEKIKDYIIETDGLDLVNCESKGCNIWGNRIGGVTEERWLYYDSVSKEIRFSEGAEEGKDRVTLYSKKVDDSISEVEISSNINGNVKPSVSQLKASAPPANEMRILPSNAREMRLHISMVSGKRLRPDIYISSFGSSPRVVSTGKVFESLRPNSRPLESASA